VLDQKYFVVMCIRTLNSMSYLWLIYQHSVTDNIMEYSTIFLNVVANTFI